MREETEITYPTKILGTLELKMIPESFLDETGEHLFDTADDLSRTLS